MLSKRVRPTVWASRLPSDVDGDCGAVPALQPSRSRRPLRSRARVSARWLPGDVSGLLRATRAAPRSFWCPGIGRRAGRLFGAAPTTRSLGSPTCARGWAATAIVLGSLPALRRHGRYGPLVIVSGFPRLARGLPLIVLLHRSTLGGHIAGRPTEPAVMVVDMVGALRFSEVSDGHVSVPARGRRN